MTKKDFMSAKMMVAVFVSAIISTSCFKDEPLNAEADIEKAYINIENPEQMFFNVTDASIDVLSSEERIVFNVRQSADLSAVAVNFDLTEGATVTPASGSVHDFGAGDVVYTVTSEDGLWHREYTVHFNRVTRTVTDVINFDFEHFELFNDPPGAYYIWHNTLADGALSDDWASGNGGFKLSISSAKPDEYPTYAYADGYDGACVKLVTRDTGPLGKMANKPIAAGNLFLGKFDSQKALKVSTILESTRFGIPFDLKPIKLTGYYKYHPGEKFIQKEGTKTVTVPDKVDTGDIYAVLFRNHDAEGNAVVLFGDNVLTSPQIVAVARIPKMDVTDDWTEFDIPFIYMGEIDEELLKERGYSLTICFAASIEGANFAGAIGSELMIDKVRLYTETEEQ